MAENTALAFVRHPVLSAPGLILFEPGTNQASCNSEALRILAYPNSPADSRRLGSFIREKLDSLFRSRVDADGGYAVAEFTSGRRHYRCTRHVLNVHGLQAQKTVVILLERIASPDVTIQELCNGLRLTDREREAVALLIRGMTSKEIAQHMGISPNTVKSFLRLVMTKAGVSTRTGLIGRVAGIVPRQDKVLPTSIQGAVAANRNNSGYQESLFKAETAPRPEQQLASANTDNNSSKPISSMSIIKRNYSGVPRNRVR